MNIIITGASNGIGFETARWLAKSGFHKIVSISRNYERLKVLAETIAHSSNTEIIILPFDLERENLSPIYDIANKLGSIDILINNAAVLINKPFLELTQAEWQNIFNVNLFSVSRLINVLFPQMKNSGNAHIVNISSMGGYLGSLKFPGLSAYSSSKAALACLTECLAVEFSQYNISVNCLALGSVQTEMLTKAFPDYKAPVTSSDMGKFIADFSLNGSKYFNGKVIPVALTTP
jgi:short-subunit dehydrogenase